MSFTNAQYTGYFWKTKDGIIYKVWYNINNPLQEYHYEFFCHERNQEEFFPRNYCFGTDPIKFVDGIFVGTD